MLLIYLINPSSNPVHVVHLSVINIDNINFKTNLNMNKGQINYLTIYILNLIKMHRLFAYLKFQNKVN